MDTVTRTYHPNGALESEVHLRDGLPHGGTRFYYDNGQLKQDIPTENGQMHGVISIWSPCGEMIDSCELQHGTGHFKCWDHKDRLISEGMMVSGRFQGRQTHYDGAGRVECVTYSIDDRRVSKAKYVDACASRPDLPRYPELEEDVRRNPPKRRPSKPKPSDPNPDELTRALPETDDPFIKLFLAGSPVEALSWLNEGSASAPRNLGEFAPGRESLEFVEELYTRGAARVLAVEIADYADAGQNTGHLLVQLPSDPNSRASLFEFEAEWAELQTGYDPVEDRGQTYFYLKLD